MTKQTTAVAIAAPLAVEPQRPEPCIVKEGKVWEPYESRMFSGYVLSKEKASATEPYLSYVGARMPLAIWHKALAFLLYCFQESKGEAQGRFYYNEETGEWDFTATPQYRSTGMSTEEIPANDTTHGGLWRNIDLKFKDPWVCFGTIHTHAAADAFQSGTDSHNEVTQGGLHVTIGKCDQKELALHARVYFKGGKYDVLWSQWIDFPRYPNVPAKFLPTLYEAVLKAPPPPDVTFPDEWKALVVPKTYNNYGGNFQGHAPWSPKGLTMSRKEQRKTRRSPRGTLVTGSESYSIPVGGYDIQDIVEELTLTQIAFIRDVGDEIAEKDFQLPATADSKTHVINWTGLELMNRAAHYWMAPTSPDTNPLEACMVKLSHVHNLKFPEVGDLCRNCDIGKVYEALVEAGMAGPMRSEGGLDPSKAMKMTEAAWNERMSEHWSHGDFCG